MDLRVCVCECECVCVCVFVRPNMQSKYSWQRGRYMLCSSVCGIRQQVALLEEWHLISRCVCGGRGDQKVALPGGYLSVD